MRRDLPNQLTVFENMLREVNAEWRDLASQGRCEAKVLRMAELRMQRLALFTCVFNIERQERPSRI